MVKGSNKGFSLVELMVVVSIIGILAAIAIPSVQKYMAKARQSEAKANLSSLYTAEKAFFAEYNTFTGVFRIVGFTPEGQLRYNIGFGSSTNSTAAQLQPFGYTAPMPTDVSQNAVGYCGAGGAMNNGCTMLRGADGAAPPAVGSVCGQNVFVATASAQIVQGAPVDTWTMNELKALNNTSNGVQ